MAKFFKTMVLLCVALPTFAQATETWFCDYPRYSDEEGSHRVKNKFVLTFIVDSKNDKAYIVGDQGSDEVHILSSGAGLSFIEITPIGNVMSTTIDSNLRSVHSRNTVIGGELIPTQYYGTCQLK